LFVLVAVPACAGTDTEGEQIVADGSVLLPDTQTVAGVLEMRHDAGARDRAPMLTLDSVPLVTLHDGGRGEFDLSRVYRPVPLADGRFVAVHTTGGARLMLFGPDGAPVRLLATAGEGPTDLMTPMEPLRLPGDTLMVIDGGNNRVSWFTADGGLARSTPIASQVPFFCFRPNGRTSVGHVVAINSCLRQDVSDTARRDPTPVVWFSGDSARMDTMAIVAGIEMVPYETRYRGVRRMVMMPRQFGQRAMVAAWGDGVAIATGEGGYSIERHGIDGTVQGRIIVDGPRRGVTEAMRADLIARELAALDETAGEGRVDIEEERRQVREVPFADSLPPYVELHSGDDGTLWVSDYALWGDSTWGHTAFRHDGAIVGRLVLARLTWPVRFWEGKVMLREEDADGVVRFGVYRIVPSRRPRG
jgi:hypothetical protein